MQLFSIRCQKGTPVLLNVIFLIDSKHYIRLRDHLCLLNLQNFGDFSSDSHCYRSSKETELIFLLHIKEFVIAGWNSEASFLPRKPGQLSRNCLFAAIPHRWRILSLYASLACSQNPLALTFSARKRQAASCLSPFPVLHALVIHAWPRPAIEIDSSALILAAWLHTGLEVAFSIANGHQKIIITNRFVKWQPSCSILAAWLA